MDQAHNVKAPLHLWIAGGLTLLWNAFGAFDYTMTQTQNASYLAQFTAEQRAYFISFPAWTVAAWAFGVWGALAGSILLLLRSRHAVAAFAVSLLGLLASTLWQFYLSDVKASDIMPGVAHYINFVIWIIAIALLFYARRMVSAGVLR
jgi:hypothetical protein